jgi:Protein of unknown function (DUF2809)
MKSIKFNFTYFTFFILLFIVEVFITLYVHDHFFRAYFGDVLVVILIYCFVLSFFIVNKITTAICVLIFSFVVEWSQYLNLVRHLGLQNNKLATVVLGNSYAFEDLICYVSGIVVVLVVEKYFQAINV